MKNVPKPLILVAIIVVGQFLAFLLSFFFLQYETLGTAAILLSFIPPFLASIVYAAVFQKMNKSNMWDYFFLQAISYFCVLIVFFSLHGNQNEISDIAVTMMLIYGVMLILPTLPVCAIYTENHRTHSRESVKIASVLAALILIPVLGFLSIFLMVATGDSMHMPSPTPERIESQTDLWQGETPAGYQ